MERHLQKGPVQNRTSKWHHEILRNRSIIKLDQSRIQCNKAPRLLFCEKQTYKNTTNKLQNSEFLIKQKTKEKSNLLENICGKTPMNNLWSGYQEQASFGARACSSISYLRVWVHHLHRAWGNYAQDISTEDHLENIHQREKLISTSSCTDESVCACVCVGVHGVHAEGCTPSQAWEQCCATEYSNFFDHF